MKSKKYVEFRVDTGTLRQIEAMAGCAGLTPFQMCATLLEEIFLKRQYGSKNPANAQESLGPSMFGGAGKGNATKK
jgi:hypothetical protein